MIAITFALSAPILRSHLAVDLKRPTQNVGIFQRQFSQRVGHSDTGTQVTGTSVCFTFFNGILSNAINRNCSFIHTAHIWRPKGNGKKCRKKNVKEKESKVGTHQRPHNTPDPRNT